LFFIIFLLISLSNEFIVQPMSIFKDSFESVGWGGDLFETYEDCRTFRVQYTRAYRPLLFFSCV